MPSTLTLGPIPKLHIGQKFEITKSVSPPGSDVTFDSSSTSVASVTDEGVITALTAGTTTITATVVGTTVTATKTVTVVAATITALSVTAPASVGEHQECEVAATATYSDGASAILEAGVTWTSSDDAKASFEDPNEGRLSGVAAGSVTITATVGTVTATATVSVLGVRSIALSPPPSIAVGEEYAFSVTATYTDYSVKPLAEGLTWTSSDEAKATVDDGRATGVAAGSVTVTATYGTGASAPTATRTLVVTSTTIASIELNAVPSLTRGETFQLVVTATFSDGTTAPVDSGVTFTSAAAGVATVTRSGGLVAAVSAGTSLVTATLDTHTASVTVTVRAAQMTGITIDTPPTLLKGQTHRFTAMATYDDGSNRPIEEGLRWSSSNTGAASFDDYTNPSVATGKAEGKPLITATTTSGLSATVELEVVEELEEEMRTVKSRFRVDVPEPKVNMSLGEPASDFGYVGVSFHADDNLMLDIGGKSLFQYSDQVTLVAKKEWWHYTSKDSIFSAGRHASLASKRQVILAAGAGYGEDFELTSGETPMMAEFNVTDLEEMLDPCKEAVRDFDEDYENKDLLAWRQKLGFKVTPAQQAQAAVAQASALAEKAKAVAMFLLSMSEVEKPTEHSYAIEQFIPELPGLLGLLKKLTTGLEKVDRWMSRPETIPLVGIGFQKMKQVKESVKALSDLTAAMGETQGVFTRGPGEWKQEYAKFDKDKKAAGSPSTAGTKDDASGKLTQASRGMKSAASLTYDDVVHLARPLRNMVRQVKEVAGLTANLIQSVSELLGLRPPPTSAAGLFGKHGVSLVSQARVFGYAPNGFHFISAKLPDEKISKWSILERAQSALKKATDGNALGNFLFGAKPPVEKGPPDFVVRVANEVDIGAKHEITINAFEGKTKVYGAEAAEVRANGVVALASLKETVEVIGKEVHLGGAIADAKSRHEKSLLLKAAEMAVTTQEGVCKPLNENVDKAQKAVDEANTKEHDLWAAYRQVKGNSRLPVDPKVEAALMKWSVALDAVTAKEGLLKAAKLVADPANVTLDGLRTAREQAAKAAEAGVKKLESAKEMDWEAENQALTEEITAGASKKVEVYGGDEVSVESGAKIELKAEGKPPAVPVPFESTVLMTDKIEIKCGQYSITVAKDKIEIQGPAGMPGITLDSGGIKMKVGATQGQIQAGEFTINSANVTVGAQAMLKLG